jgi:flagellar hook-associated protein 2
VVSSIGISFGGIASGLDTNAIIDALMEIQRQPIQTQQVRREIEMQKRDALAQVGASFSSLRGMLENLTKLATFTTQGTSVVAQADDQDKVLASANGSAAIGSFDLDVVQIATATRVRSTAAAGEAIDSAAALNEAGFIQPFVAGTFTINSTEFTIPDETPTTIVSASAIGTGVDPTVTLDSAGLDIAPSGGDFVINGVTISFDETVDTLNDVITRINQSAAGVTASFDQATDQLTLTATENGPGLFTLSDTTGNFLEAVELIDGGGAKIGTETDGTNQISLDDVVQMINLSGAGVIASIENDSGGRPNILRIADDPVNGAQAVQLGAGSDTSNFLEITHLLESPGTTTRDGTRGMGGMLIGEPLDSARLATPVIATGTFEINGVEFDYDASVDSISKLITRINQSTAEVTASYDPFDDKLVLASNETGSTAIQLSDVSGDFLAQMGMLAATQETGQNAQYQIDGGPIRYATSNVVSDAVAGVTLTFSDTTTNAVSVEVFHDSAPAKSAAKDFVDAYNETAQLIDDLTRFDEDGENGLLIGDGTLRRAEQSLRSILTGSAYGLSGNLRTLSDVGISFGAVGADVGATNQLVFDESKMDAALDQNPDAVAQLFATFQATASLNAGTGSIASMSSGQLTVTFTPDDGSTPVSQTGAIAPGGTNTTLIPGVTLTAAGTLVDGVDTITIAPTERGIGRALYDYVDSLTRAGGTFSSRDDEFQARIDSIDDQIDRLERRADAREAQLVRQYTALELTISRLQSQQQALAGMTAQLNASRPQQQQQG